MPCAIFVHQNDAMRRADALMACETPAGGRAPGQLSFGQTRKHPVASDAQGRIHDVLDLRTVEGIAEKISGLLPPDARVLRDEFKTNVRLLLETTLARMDLVTCEEFEAQAAMLRRTREKLEALEARLADIEQGTG
jgi:ubiquinone biosynthesis accessory factor UbiK